MPIRPFELSKGARKRRKDFFLFICAAAIGIILGILIPLLSSPLPYSQFILYEIFSLIFLGFVVVLCTIKVIIQPEDIHHIMPLYIAYSRDTGMIVPITNRSLGFIERGAWIMREGATVNPEPIEIMNSNDSNAIIVLIRDLIMYGLLDWLSQKHRLWWAPKIRYTGISYLQQSYRSSNEVNSKNISYSDLPEQMREQNIFFRLYGESLISHRQLQVSVPNYTKFRWAQQDGLSHKNTVSFCNKYCNLIISVSYSMGGVGLFPFASNFFLTQDGQEIEPLHLQQHFSHIIFEMDFHATFNWFWSLIPTSNDYFNWIEDMRDGLDAFFNFEREYEDLEQLDNFTLE